MSAGVTTARERRVQRAEQRRSSFSLMRNLALREIRAEYKRTLLGRVWSLLNPVAQIAIFSLVFGVLFEIEAPPGTNSGVDFFPLWIGIGVITWGYVSGSISGGMSALLGNAGLLSKVYFERSVLVIASIVASTTTFLTELAVLVVIMAFVGGPAILLTLPLLVPLLALTIAFVIGLSLMLSVALVFFRDLEHLWRIFTQIWLYASGVMFPVTLVQTAQDRFTAEGVLLNGQPLPLVTLFELNPAERILASFRNIIYDYAVPSLDTWLYIGLWSFGMLVIGALVFRRFSRNVVEEL
ncbi:ABC transporter permease [Agrococcus versicolor]|uniref:Transport permease protein n=1 Tax=Agrococcus versicolor TaxID=501482 RepID=A0ABP5MCX4_9MICO